MLNEIQSNVPGEFQYRYTYQSSSGKIKRYIDYTEGMLTTDLEVIELGYNASDIELEIDETSNAIAASPTGQPQNKDDTFHEDREAFKQLTIHARQEIPQYYTKKDKTYTPGPLVKTPYNKEAYTDYIISNEPGSSSAHYKYIQSK
jgi:hypothetical protein